MGDPTMKVVQFPPCNAVQNVPEALRSLAASIEAGEFGDAHNIAYVVDCGEQELGLGLLGPAPDSGTTAYYLFGRAMRKLEGL